MGRKLWRRKVDKIQQQHFKYNGKMLEREQKGTSQKLHIYRAAIK